MAVRPPGTGPLLIWNNGSPLTRDRFMQEIRSLTNRVGLNASSFAGYSFRIGRQPQLPGPASRPT